MATAILIHNPTAGNGTHSKRELMKAIKSFGYEGKYYSTDVPGWEKFTQAGAEKIFVAGGDGTVQKVAGELLKANDRVRTTPIQVLPLGTANNIATTLGIDSSVSNLMDHEQTVAFDTGQVKGIGEADFFIEAIGAGIFPKLVKAMKAKEEEQGVPDDPEEEMRESLQELMKIVHDYDATEAICIADGEEITGRFLLVECMNIRYIGPNFELAPNAETGDGAFELVTIPEESRGSLLTYIRNILNKEANDLRLDEFAELRKVKELRLKWQGNDVHVDDETELTLDTNEIQVKNRQGSFNFSIQH